MKTKEKYCSWQSTKGFIPWALRRICFLLLHIQWSKFWILRTRSLITVWIRIRDEDRRTHRGAISFIIQSYSTMGKKKEVITGATGEARLHCHKDDNIHRCWKQERGSLRVNVLLQVRIKVFLVTKNCVGWVFLEDLLIYSRGYKNIMEP
jgi:hypothetical protein